MQRRHGVVVGVLVALAVLLWRCHGDAPKRDTAGTSPTATTLAGGSAASGAAKPKVDPRTQARGSIAGTVRDEAKAPIAGARVCADLYAELLPTELTREPRCVLTGPDGAYVMKDLYMGTYVVVAGARTFRPATYRPDPKTKKTSWKLAAGEAKVGVDLVLLAGGVEVTGVVNDISGGPVAHALVSAAAGMWGNGDSTPVVETATDGTFSLWIRPGAVRLTAVADGYAPSSETGRAPGRVTLLLTPESSLSGTVVDAQSGAPIANAEVEVAQPRGWWEGRGSERSDAQGKFRVDRLTPGRYVATARTEHGYGHTEGSTLVGLGQHVDGVVVKVFPAARITGKVMIVEGGTRRVCTEGSVGFRDTTGDGWLSSRTEDDGTVIASGVLPGTYTAQVWCSGYQGADTYPPIVVADKDIDGLTWEVTPGATVRGKVLTKSGAPVADAEISAQTTGGDVRAKSDWGSDTSKADGSYELTPLKAATYRIEVESDHGLGPKDGVKIDVPAAGTVTKDVVLDDGGTIEGLVIDAEGAPVPDVKVVAQSAVESMWWGRDEIRSDATGAFTIPSLRAGDYRVIARRSWSDELRKPGTTDDAKQGEKAVVKVGETTKVKLVVEAQSATIKGVVVDTEGKPVSDAFISSARESDAAGARQDGGASATRGWGWGDAHAPILTNPDGTFTVTKLSPGKYTLRAYRKGGGEAIAEHVATGATARLQIKRTGSIAGVVKSDGALPLELTVELEDLKTGFERRESYFRTEGRFAIEDLPAGHFHLTVSASDRRAKIELDLADGEARTGVAVTLEALVTLTGRVVERGTQKPVPGMMVFATIAQGGGFQFSMDSEDNENITDATGRFVVKRAPQGKLAIQGMAKEWKESDYTWFRVIKTVTGSGTVDLGDLGVIKKRLKDGEPAGEMGVHFVDQPNDTPPEKTRLEISFIEPGGAAAKTELKVGDVFTSVDGVDITGENAMNGWTLMRAPPGTKLTIGLARGTTITLTLAPPS